jgi:hypothetical protein
MIELGAEETQPWTVPALASLESRNREVQSRRAGSSCREDDFKRTSFPNRE